MKLKKFFAGVLAAAMMLTVGATAAFADTPSDNVISVSSTALESNGSFKLTKNYKVEKGVAPFEEFTFKLNYVGYEKKDSKVTTLPNVSNVEKKAKFDNTIGGSTSQGLPAKTDGAYYTKDFTIDISDLKIRETGTGIYVYKITEDQGSTPAVKYDNSELYMVVTVTHKVDTNKNIIDGYDYYVALRRGGSVTNNADGSITYVEGEKVQNTNAFTNTYGKDGDNETVHDLVISKEIAGSFADLGETFEFDVTLTGEKKDDKDLSYAGATVVHSDDKADNGVKAKDVWEIGATKTVKLGRNDYIQLSNLPAGVTVTVLEKSATVENGKVVSGDYTVTLNKANKTIDSKNFTAIGDFGAQEVAANTVGAETTNSDSHITIVNTKEGTPDMGVVLDNAPYIAMLAIVAIGGVALMLNKRRRDEE